MKTTSTTSAHILLLCLSNALAFAPVSHVASTRAWRVEVPIAVRTFLFAEKDSTALLEKELTYSTTIDMIKTDEAMSTTVVEATPQPAAEEEELSETKKLMQKVKDAGTAGVISYALWELGFWAVSVPVVLFGYVSLTGHFPNLSDKDDLGKLGAEAFAFVNFARFAVPLRIGLALSTTPWIQENIVDRFTTKKNEEQGTTKETLK